MKDNIYLVIREKDNVVVSIMMNKLDHTYSFVNLTKGHICTCKFDSIEDAIKDMKNYTKHLKMKELYEVSWKMIKK